MILSAVLLSILVGSNMYLGERLAEGSEALSEEARFVRLLKTANTANRAFGELRYWLTDHAVSLLLRSERRAKEARATLETTLLELKVHDPETVGIVHQELDKLTEKALLAVDAYIRDQRVLGNSLMAQARVHIEIVDEQLAALVNRLESESLALRDSAVESSAKAVDISIVIGVVATLVGVSLTILILQSITVPLNRLVGAMSKITKGDLEADIPNPGHDEIGAMTRTLSLFRDSLVERDRETAARQEAEQALRRAKVQLYDAIESISEGFAFYDADDRLIDCNRKYAELFRDFGVDVAQGSRFEDIIRAAAESGQFRMAEGRVDAWVEERIERHRSLSGPFEQERSDGRWLRINECRTSEGGVVAVVSDITVQKENEVRLGNLVDSLAEARDQALQATQAKSQFLANMSHELCTPLNVVIGIAQMLYDDAKDAGNEDLMEPLEYVHREGMHLLHLINEVLDISKIESGKLENFVEEFDLPDMLRSVVSASQSLAKQNGNTLALRCPMDRMEMRSDQTRVRQIVENLVGNACKFTQDGEVTVEVAEESAGDSPGVRLAFSDTGIGMTPEQVERLFEEFVQADSSTTKKYGGTGLGLAICQRLCEILGGKIDVESKLGEGTTFTVRLPVRLSDEPDTRTAQTGEIPSDTADGKRAEQTTNTILVIDDDPIVCDLMHNFLTREGYSVTTARDGDEGLKLARIMKPSVITLDVYMPGRDGWDVLRELKRDDELKWIPVVMATISEEKNKGYALGAMDYVVKPIERSQLREILDKYRRDSETHHVLVVDDDEPMRNVLKSMLIGEGWKVTEAENGREALNCLKQNVPDLIVLDLLMPEMDGFAFLDAWRKDGIDPTVPVVVLTGAELSSDERRQLNGGVERILEKGSKTKAELLDELREIVARCVSRQQT